MYDMKALYEAKDVEDAIRLRIEHPEAQIIAGGSDVLVQMREGKRAGKELISYDPGVFTRNTTYALSLASVILSEKLSAHAGSDNTITIDCRISTGELLNVYTGTLAATSAN